MKKFSQNPAAPASEHANEPAVQSASEPATKPAPEPTSADSRDQQITELVNDLKRTRADFENYRKQMDAQKASVVKLAEFDTVKKFLPLLDDLDRAIKSTPDLQPLEKTLEKTIKSLDLAKIPAAAGTEFNPDFHDAISMEDGEGSREVIAEVLRDGYLYRGEVLRPAMVKVKSVA